MIQLYNTAARAKQEFTPLDPNGPVRMYHCGPTVYGYAHIGNLRSFLLADLIRRVMEYSGYEVLQVMNITDIGHLVGDGDEGEDKMTRALKAAELPLTLENMLALGDTYAQAFVADILSMNIKMPHHLPKASDHIEDDLRLIEKLQAGGHVYEISDGLYFDTSTFPDYGLFMSPVTDDAQQRIINPEKRQPADFALWKFDEQNGWSSPWGQGFPGWHIECSGMSMHYLGETLDIHTGGIDNAPTHHTNEVAQSQAATGKQFVRYWLHGEHLQVDNGKMAKSAGTGLTLRDIEAKGFSGFDLRYFYLQAHYRTQQNFTWDALQAAQNGLNNLRDQVLRLGEEVGEIDTEWHDRFQAAVSDDLNMPQALAVLHDMLRAPLPAAVKKALVINYDSVLGLNLDQPAEEISIDEAPAEVQNLLEARSVARHSEDWERADELRGQIHELGYEIIDTKDGQELQRV